MLKGGGVVLTKELEVLAILIGWGRGGRCCKDVSFLCHLTLRLSVSLYRENYSISFYIKYVDITSIAT